MLRALESPAPVRPVPWRAERAAGAHPRVINAGREPLDFVRAFIDAAPVRATEHWGQVLPGEAIEICLCDADVERTEAIVTIAWFQPRDGLEYLWRLVL
ncbi:hypothetical protein ACFQRL_06365 [Microbacterium fluvii]|uniref:PilZ domain-containing protein n=1 Tax=Microbacterium fluvii TaxID=415215 RepID=A0ABW2HBU1_9MICO|nr:hypothetical protein [Microbacterium fluvii]MCU4672208.1 hypothetical protein [Microbacterium fluvii]